MYCSIFKTVDDEEHVLLIFLFLSIMFKTMLVLLIIVFINTR